MKTYMEDRKLKEWLALVCPVCGWRHSLRKFGPMTKPILYPLQIVTGGGRAKGFRTARYLPWSALPQFTNTEAWNSVLYLYSRLGASYDHFYDVLGFLSPRIKTLLSQSSYGVAYQPNPVENYSAVYGAVNLAQDVADAYADDDISSAYSASFFLASGRCEI